MCFVFMTLNTFGQRKKIVKKPISGVVITKLDKVAAEFFKNTLYVIIPSITDATQKDTIILKPDVQKNAILNPTISLIKTKTNQFYAVSWTENNLTTTKLKTEDATTIFTEICDFSTKLRVLSNFQKTTKIKEIRFFDANQTVSETIDKVRKEGNEIKILPDGDVILINKKGETKLTFSPAEKIYVIKKK